MGRSAQNIPIIFIMFIEPIIFMEPIISFMSMEPIISFIPEMEPRER